jgi:hypothetical protein
MFGTVIIFYAFFFFFVQRSQLWADSVGVLYSAWTVRMLSRKVVCSQHFSDVDFMSLDCLLLSSVVILCTILTLTISTATCRTFVLYPSCEFLVTTCCLYRLPSCSETD